MRRISLNRFKYFPVFKINNALIIWCASVRAHKYKTVKMNAETFTNGIQFFFVFALFVFVLLLLPLLPNVFALRDAKILEKYFCSEIEFQFVLPRITVWFVHVCVCVCGRVQSGYAADLPPDRPVTVCASPWHINILLYL